MVSNREFEKVIDQINKEFEKLHKEIEKLKAASAAPRRQTKSS